MFIQHKLNAEWVCPREIHASTRDTKDKNMSKKIKVELTENQYMTISEALQSHCLDIMGGEYIDNLIATENRVINNALTAMTKGYKEWKEGK